MNNYELLMTGFIIVLVNTLLCLITFVISLLDWSNFHYQHLTTYERLNTLFYAAKIPTLAIALFLIGKVLTTLGG